MKKVLCFIVALGLLTTSVSAAPAGGKRKFRDVPNGYWAQESIEYFQEQGIVDGTSETEFEPDADVTREQCAKLLYLLFADVKAEPDEQTFIDVAENRWSFPYIEQVKDYLTWWNTDEGAVFYPQSSMTREDIAYSLVKITGMDKSGTWNEKILDRYSDADKISPAMRVYVAIAVEKGLLGGYEDGSLRPQKGVTRAELVTLLFRCVQKPGIENPDDDVLPPTDEENDDSEKENTKPSDNEKIDKQNNGYTVMQSDNITAFYEYAADEITGKVMLKLSAKDQKVDFDAKIRVNKTASETEKYDIELEKLTSCTENKIEGIFEITIGGSEQHEECILTVFDDRLELEDADGEIILTALLKKSTGQDKPSKDENKTKPSKDSDYEVDNEHFNEDFYRSTMLFGEAQKMNGKDASGSLEIFIGKEAKKIRAAMKITEGDNKWEIELQKLISFDEDEIEGLFKVTCNGKVIKAQIEGEIDGFDTNDIEKIITFESEDEEITIKFLQTEISYEN